MGFNLEVTNIDLSGVNKKLGKSGVKKAQKVLTERVGRDSNIHCPVDSGDTKRSMTISDQEVKWTTPYAKYPYYGGHVRNDNESNKRATSAWFETAKSEHLDDWKKVVSDKLSEG